VKGGEGGYGDKESGVGRAEFSGDGEAKKKKRGPVAGFFPGVQRSRQEADDVQSMCACAVDGRLPDKHSGVRDAATWGKQPTGMDKGRLDGDAARVSLDGRVAE